MHRSTGSQGIVPLLFLVAGCGSMFGGGLQETEWSMSRADRYDGPECGRVIKQDIGNNDYNQPPGIRDDPTPESQILVATCVRRQKPVAYEVTGRDRRGTVER
jgi:hypothetical protein